jgi:nitrate/TMAO reductase-like tetraheme cytochrome c subunit
MTPHFLAVLRTAEAEAARASAKFVAECGACHMRTGILPAACSSSACEQFYARDVAATKTAALRSARAAYAG